MKGRLARHRRTDRVLLWAGSLLDWQDPLTLIRGVAQLAATRGPTSSCSSWARGIPNPLVPPMRVVEESRSWRATRACSTRTCSSTTGCRTQSARRYLREADLGLSARIASTSKRTSRSARGCSTTCGRGLPIVCTRGDHFATLVEATRPRRGRPARRRDRAGGRDRRTARRQRRRPRAARRDAIEYRDHPRRNALEPRRRAAGALLRAAVSRRRSRAGAARVPRASRAAVSAARNG